MISRCCLSSSMKNIFLQLESIDEKDNVKIIAYKKTLYALYKKYKMKKCASYLLRGLQFLTGLGVTTLTTYNNPYFKDNITKLNIVVWYISLSNNIVNIALEKVQSYNIADEKLKIKLLVGEGHKYLDNYKDYSLYNPNDPTNKLLYFEKCYKEIIDQTPYKYLIYQSRRPSHVTYNTKQKKLDICKAWEGSDEKEDNIFVEQI